MPRLDGEGIKARIADGSVFAVSMDTAIVDGKKGGLNNAVLRKLDQFKGQDIRVVVSEIVAREIQRHLAQDAAETQRGLRKALRQHLKLWQLTKDVIEESKLNLKSDPHALATKQFDEFLAAIGGEKLSATENASFAAKILNRYFGGQAPFGDSDRRKHEFPDAFALFSLECLAQWSASRKVVHYLSWYRLQIWS